MLRNLCKCISPNPFFKEHSAYLTSAAPSGLGGEERRGEGGREGGREGGKDGAHHNHVYNRLNVYQPSKRLNHCYTVFSGDESVLIHVTEISLEEEGRKLTFVLL